MKTVIYTRGQGAQQQIEACERFAGERGLDIKAITESPEELENAILTGEYSIVLVSHISRLTRRYDEYLRMKRVFESLGIEIAAAQ